MKRLQSIGALLTALMGGMIITIIAVCAVTASNAFDRKKDATDTLAVGVLRGCQRRGLEVGREVAVVGFDDTPTAAALDLSSVRQPIEAVGRHLIAALLGEPGTGKLLLPELVIRSSSA